MKHHRYHRLLQTASNASIHPRSTLALIDVTMIKSRSRAELHLACWSSSLLRKYLSAPRKTLLHHLHLPKVMMMVKMMKMMNRMKMMMLIMMKHISTPRKNLLHYLHLPEVILMMLIAHICHHRNHQILAKSCYVKCILQR